MKRSKISPLLRAAHFFLVIGLVMLGMAFVGTPSTQPASADDLTGSVLLGFSAAGLLVVTSILRMVNARYAKLTPEQARDIKISMRHELEQYARRRTPSDGEVG
jgi:hypothetical protein